MAAENLLQHAEHYFRLIAAAQAAQQQAQQGYGRNGEDIDDEDDDDFVALPDRFASPIERAPQIQPAQAPQPNGGPANYGNQPQPYFDRPAFNGEPNERPVERQDRQDRNFDRNPNANPERQERQPRNDRRFGPGGERTGGDRPQGQGRNRFRDQQPRFDANSEQPRVDFEPLTSALPAFITAPTRIVAPPSAPQDDQEAFAPQPPISAEGPAPATSGEDDGENRFHLRPRRRRRPRAAEPGEGGDSAPLPETSSVD